MSKSRIRYFEKKNSIGINLFGCKESVSYKDKKKIVKTERFPIRPCSPEYKEFYDLFLHDGHYSAIKNLSRFCGYAHTHVQVCCNCLASYNNETAFLNHTRICSQLNEKGSAVRMPEEYTSTEFNHHKYCHQVPVVIYADTESVFNENKEKEAIKGSVATHKAMTCDVIIDSKVHLEDIPLAELITSSYTAEKFMIHMYNLNHKITEILNKKLEKYATVMRLTEEDEQNHENATTCCFCNKELGTDKVKDHDHFTGWYFGAAHASCNLKAKHMNETNN